MRRALLEALTTWSPANSGAPWSPPAHPILLGWVDRPLVAVQVDGHPVRNQSAYLVIVHLPAK